MLSGAHRHPMVPKVELTHTEETVMRWIGMEGSPLEVLVNGNVVMNGSPLGLKTVVPVVPTARSTSYVAALAGW